MNAEIKTNVIKRNGEEVAFDLEKIINAIKGANKDVDKLHRMNIRLWQWRTTLQRKLRNPLMLSM